MRERIEMLFTQRRIDAEEYEMDRPICTHFFASLREASSFAFNGLCDLHATAPLRLCVRCIPHA